MVGRVLGLVQHQLGRGPAELVTWLAHRGERHRGGSRELDVVVADDGQVLRARSCRCRSRAGAGRAPCRSFAQNAAVGRRDDTRPASRPPASRPAATSSDWVVTTVRSEAGRPAAAQALRAPCEPVADLAERHRAADEGDPLVATVDEMLDREPAAEQVVDGHGAERRVVAGPVDDDQRRAVVAGSSSSVCDSGSTGVTRMPWTRCCWSRCRCACSRSLALAAGAQHEGEVDRLGRGLHALGDIGEERVARVEHHVGERAAGARRAAVGPTRCGRTRARPSPARPGRGWRR